MNKVILIGRLTRDPEVRYTNGHDPLCIARYILAVDRRFRKEGETAADFIPCAAFGKTGEFAEQYFKKGMKVAITGRIQTGSYTDRDGKKIYTTEVVIEEQEFAESKNASHSGNTRRNDSQPKPQPQPQTDADGFMNIPEGLEEELPFS